MGEAEMTEQMEGPNLKHAISLAKKGEKEPARQILVQIVEVEPDNELAWLWLADCAMSNEERRMCLMRALRINPNNVYVRNALEKQFTPERTTEPKLEPLKQSVLVEETAVIKAEPSARPAQVTTVRIEQAGHGCLAQVLWFLFIGWWAGQIWIGLAWILILTILGIPISVMMLNKLPSVIALRGKPDDVVLTIAQGVTVVSTQSRPQRNLLLRIVYFFLIGWWASAFWMEIAYIFCLIIIGMPIGFWMFDRTPAVVSLRR